MRRYWIEASQLVDETVSFHGDQFHHIFDVCRQDLHSKFEVLHPNRKAYLIEITERGKKTARGRVIESRELPPLPRPLIRVAMSLPKFATFDSVLEKLVEMGVHSVHPFFSEFSFLRDPKKFPEEKLQRWKKIITSATQQSGRGELMDVHPPRTWSEMMTEMNRDAKSLCLFAYEGKSPRGIHEFLEKQKLENPDPENVWILVGSEGGFSETEVQKAQEQGFYPVTLGPQVLRVETACMTLVSVLKYEFDLMR